ncbi:MAG TPA: S-methyl-5-thioribose-1-phosphate isomerase [Ktedonobacteraceae bacterium]|nr:S-methyl-5-thioribose-1-phosphate isomerase [Ktedonobacteraceae bacterium]
MAAQHQRVRTVWWEEGAVCMLDQSLLPLQVDFLRLTHEQQVADAIVSLKVRGAPAIGATAALGMLLAAQRFLREEGAHAEGTQASAALQSHLVSAGQLLARTRPTAVNLFWAIERMQRCIDPMMPPQTMLARLRDEALTIAAEDVAACRQMGAYGAELIADGDTLLTHCNAGALATSGMGTALAPIYTAQQAGKHIHVFVDETRPVLQGARLTAWELQQQGVPLTLITDNMAGHFMQQGAIKAVFVGADRIAANGDVANKIGTYSVAVLAQAHSIPFYVVAPCSTIDLALPSGEHIPIEQRNPDEVTSVGGVAIAPAGVQVANPAFDVTPHALVSAIITEKGILRAPYTSALRQLFASENMTGKV